MNLQKIIFIETGTAHTLLFKSVCEALDLEGSCTFLPSIPVSETFFQEVDQYCLFHADKMILIMNVDAGCFVSAVKFIRTFKSVRALKRVPLIVISSLQEQAGIHELMLSGVNSFFTMPYDAAQTKKLVKHIIRYWALEYVR